MSEYKVAIVGCGGRAPAHIDAYEHIDNAKVVACCAPSPKRRDPLAEKYNIKPYGDVAEMVRAEKPDMVHLVTWPDTRVELMTLVSELGVPLCTTEKPLVTNERDWRSLSALSAITKTKFAVCHQFRWQKHLVMCQEAMRTGALGKPLFLDISAGMNISGQGTHTLNYGMSIIGDPKVTQVYGSASGWDAKDVGHPAPASTEAYLQFENGVRGLWTSGPVSPRCGNPETVYQHVRAAAYAERGRVNYEEFGKWEIVGPNGVEKGDYGAGEVWLKNNIMAQADFHKAMFAWLEDESELPGTNLNQSLHESAVVLALYQSALERRPIDMATFDPPDGLAEEATKALTV